MVLCLLTKADRREMLDKVRIQRLLKKRNDDMAYAIALDRRVLVRRILAPRLPIFLQIRLELRVPTAQQRTHEADTADLARLAEIGRASCRERV